MKLVFPLSFIVILTAFYLPSKAQTAIHSKPVSGTRLFLDIHHLPAGTVKFEDVAAAHAKDLATEGKYGVHFIKYWVDENRGTVYCLSSATDSMQIKQTHREAHGLMPREILEVTDGLEALPVGTNRYFLDIHNLGAGKVTAADVANAHQKDLAVQQKYGVHFLNYWVDETNGIVVCLSQAPDASGVINTHKEAHGLIPDSVVTVKQGQ